MSFPKDFFWGVATSAHQIEGNNRDSDWWHWEQQGSKIRLGEKSAAACEHWNRVEEDIALLQFLGVKMYRFSVEWAKIQDHQGRWNQKNLQHYRRELELLHAAGITPMLSLHHFTHPQWFVDQSGWLNAKSPELFLDFVKQCFLAFGDLVSYYITFNEPMVFLSLGYGANLFPPGYNKPKACPIALDNILRAHALTYRYLHEQGKNRQQKLMVGMAHHIRSFHPARRYHPIDSLLAWTADQFFHQSLLDALLTGELKIRLPLFGFYQSLIPGLAGSQDFLGINYYSRDYLRFSYRDPNRFRIEIPAGAPLTDLNWEIYPQGMGEACRRLHKMFPSLPIFITENGLADAQDKLRSAFLFAHLQQLEQLLAEGLPLRGYLHWSLLDNFEWIEGFGPRFGLFAVDYATQKRSPRPSAFYYREIIAGNKLLPPPST